MGGISTLEYTVVVPSKPIALHATLWLDTLEDFCQQLYDSTVAPWNGRLVRLTSEQMYEVMAAKVISLSFTKAQ